MKFTIVLLLSPLISSFVVKPNIPRSFHELNVAEKPFDASSAGQNIDMDRARECAGQFGKCSLKEVEELRDCKWNTIGFHIHPGNLTGRSHSRQ